jgi:hypothetical protein
MEPTEADLLDLDIDLRIGVEAWVELWTAEEATDALLSALLRFAYGRGYNDALTEPRRGQLCRDHGFHVPTRARPA